MAKTLGLVTSDVVRMYESLGTVSATARAFGVTRKTIRQHLHKSGIGAIASGTTSQAAPEVSDLPSPGAVKRYILTCAQNNTYIWKPVWENLLALAAHYDAEVLVSTFTYNKNAYSRLSVKRSSTPGNDGEDLWYDPEILPYIAAGDQDLELAPGLVWCGRMNTLPTAERPLSGFETYTGRKSGIFPHVKLAMHSVPSAKFEATKFNYTTGTVTKLNYIQKKAGLKAEHHHCYGGLLVEVTADGNWYVRQLQADAQGRICDLTLMVAGGQITADHGVEGITWGDFHAAQLDPVVRQIAWGKGGVVDTLKPKHQFLHDTLDFRARNHHERRNPHLRFQRFIEGEDTVEDELRLTADLVKETLRPWCKIHVVDSNHDNALGRWLRETDYREDPPNALIFLKLQLAKYQAIANRDKTFHLAEFALRSAGCPEEVHFLREDESFVLCKNVKDGGIENGWHGHLGPDGVRGTPNNLKRAGRRANTGHTHSAGILDGLFTAGTCSKLDVGWNPGPSSWSHSFIVTYSNGKRAILTMWAGAAYAV